MQQKTYQVKLYVPITAIATIEVEAGSVTEAESKAMHSARNEKVEFDYRGLDLDYVEVDDTEELENDD